VPKAVVSKEAGQEGRLSEGRDRHARMGWRVGITEQAVARFGRVASNPAVGVEFESHLRGGDIRLGPMYTRLMRDSISQPTDQLQKSDAPPACDRSSWPVWVGRVGEPQPKADYCNLTPSQRIALCWEATKQAWAITGMELDESAFRRDSESFSRRGG